jgi:hypothetical protein
MNLVIVTCDDLILNLDLMRTKIKKNEKRNKDLTVRVPECVYVICLFPIIKNLK